MSDESRNVEVYGYLVGPGMEDIAEPAVVEIEIRADGKVVWVHVNGATALRCCRIGEVVINDHRSEQKRTQEHP